MSRRLFEALDEVEIPCLKDSMGRNWSRARKVSDLMATSSSSVLLSSSPSPARLPSPHKIIRMEEFDPEDEDYLRFAVRRSERKTEAFLLNRLLTTTNDATLGLKVFDTGDRGRGIKTSRLFSKGDLVLEYVGELVSEEEAESRVVAQPTR